MNVSVKVKAIIYLGMNFGILVLSVATFLLCRKIPHCLSRLCDMDQPYALGRIQNQG